MVVMAAGVVVIGSGFVVMVLGIVVVVMAGSRDCGGDDSRGDGEDGGSRGNCRVDECRRNGGFRGECRSDDCLGDVLCVYVGGTVVIACPVRSSQHVQSSHIPISVALTISRSSAYPNTSFLIGY